MACGISCFYVLSALLSTFGSVFSESELNATQGDDFAISGTCASKILHGLPSNSLWMLRQGEVDGLKVKVYRDQMANNTTDWMLVREDAVRNVLFSVNTFNPIAHWALSASFPINVLSVLENPSNCLGDFRSDGFRVKIRQLVLNHIHGHVSESINLCAKEVMNVSGTAVEIFNCCTRNSSGVISCQEIQEDELVEIFFGFIFVLKILLVIFIERCIPKSLYRKRHCYKEFIFSLTAPLEIEITKRFSTPPNVSKLRTVNLGTEYVSCGYQHRMKLGENLHRLSDVIETMEMSKTEHFKLRAVWFKGDPDRLVWRNKAPVGFFSFLYRRLFQCKCYVHGRKQKVLEHTEDNVDDEYVSLHNCCKRKISKDSTWESFLRNMMQVFAALFVFWIPIIAITVYWDYEEDFIQNRKEAAKHNNLTMILSLYSTKLISLSFIHGCYSLYQACFALWFLPLLMLITIRITTDDTLWKRTVWIFVRSVVYTKHFSNIGISWVASFLLRSFTSNALTDVNAIHIFLWVIVKLTSLFIAVVVLLFCKLSSINLFLQLFWRFLGEIVKCVRKSNDGDKRSDMEDLVLEKSKNTHEKSVRSFLNLPSIEVGEIDIGGTSFPRSPSARFWWCIICIGWLAFLICSIPIFIDISFIIVDILVLIILCLVANMRHLAQYFLIVLFTFLYANMFLKRVERTFQHFNNKVQNFLLERHTRSLISKNLHDDTIPDTNRCYQVIPGRGCGRCAACHVFTTRNGVPKWKARHLVQFVDDKGEPCIPKNFFFQTCYMKHFACPGSLSNHYYDAMIKSFLLAVYIVVVILMVKVVYPSLPWWGHLLVYILCGFLPILILKIFFDDPKQNEYDTADDIFKQKLEHVIREYKQEWSIIDLEISRRAKLDESITSILEGNDDENNTKCWFRARSKACVCLHIPNRKPINVDDTIQTESVPPTPTRRTPSRNGFNDSRIIRGQWNATSNSPRQISKSLQTSPQSANRHPLLKSLSSFSGTHNESWDTIDGRPPTRSSSGKQKNSRVPSDEITHEGSEMINFLPKSYPGACCVNTKDDTISIASTLSNHSHDQHHQETISTILKNMKFLNSDKRATQTLVADV
ncbi:uncharacterized protein LOC133172067 [Saccostrea echinata]|uniref:uncharacterized protein LOC133172067 n=1 Tax=Saccostrea echinata TaxID=191078 RepID=UPI002A80DD87|nr:uncharacterized protein LOC133172067 [Saccostrea echinata]